MSNINELFEEQYRLEKEYAYKIKKSVPFSLERNLITKEAYQKINEMIEKRTNEKEAFGYQVRYVNMIRQLIKNNDTFFEAGVGTGFLIEEISKLPSITSIGCDTFLDPNFIKETKKYKLIEDTLYNSLLMMEDNSLDFFYWNDVMEHICPDEIDETLKVLHKKMKRGGIILTITPNALTGPHDITAFADSKEKIAQGLHLKEYSFTEVKNAFQKANFVTKGHFIKRKGKDVFTSHLCKFHDSQRVFLEKLLRIISIKTLSRYFVFYYDLNVSVMQK